MEQTASKGEVEATTVCYLYSFEWSRKFSVLSHKSEGILITDLCGNHVCKHTEVVRADPISSTVHSACRRLDM